MLKEIKKKLTEFKLAGIARELEDKVKIAQSENLSHLEFINILLEEEDISRKNNSLKKRAYKSKLEDKRIENFDFTFQPTINKTEILNLCSCGFIEKKENIIFMGKPGTGKSHLACSIGWKALLRGYSVVFISAHKLINDLNLSKADGTYYSKMESYTKPDLLIIDEIGFKKFTQNNVDDFFEIVNQRYEKKSIIITSNKPFDEWASVLSDHVLASAIIDRLIHYCNIISIKGDSYRAKNQKNKKTDKDIEKNNE